MQSKLKNYAPFFLLIIGLFFIFGYHEILPKHPQSSHQWRQTDSGAQVMRYVHNNLNILDAGTYNFQSTDGKGVCEFPIAYVFDAVLIKLGLPRDFTLRAVNLLLFYLGIIYLFKISMLLLQSRILALLPVAFFSSSPLICYYAPTPLPNLPAIAFAIIGTFYFAQYYLKKENKDLLFFLVFSTLAGLIKPPAFVPFLSVFCVVLLGPLFKFKDFKLSRKAFVYFAIPILFLLAWIKIASVYNAAHLDKLFLIVPKPIWNLDKAFIDEISRRLKAEWVYEYSYLPTLSFAAFGSLIFLLIPQKTLLPFKLLLLAMLCGTAAYFYLLFEQFYHHDYYGLDLIPLALAFFIAGVYLVSIIKQKALKNSLTFLIAILLIFNIDYARKNIQQRYVVGTALTAKDDIYLKLQPKLRALGIQPQDKFIVSNDHSSNISLYLLDQFGWTRFRVGLDSTLMEKYVEEGAQYFIADTAELKLRNDWHPYLGEQILEEEHLAVYEIQ